MLSRNITAARTAKGLTRNQLAELLDVSRVAVYNWEEGECKPTIGNLARIAAHCDTTIDALVSRRKWAA